jgi:prepilin-type N-terminal cleavage/methylation domain-containing protein
MIKSLKAFTLLEIMLAVLIFSIIMGSVISSMASVQNASRIITSETQMNELCNRVVMNTALKLSASKILVAEPDKVSFQKIIGVYPELQLGAVEAISFTELKEMYPQLDDVFKGKIPIALQKKYEMDPAVPLKGLFFKLKDDNMLIGMSVSGSNEEQFMTKTFFLETKLLGDAHE